MKFCKNCGVQLEQEVNFCGECGTAINKQATPTTEIQETIINETVVEKQMIYPASMPKTNKSENSKLLGNEVQLDSLTGTILLTNYRIMNDQGSSYKFSVFLDKISSIEMQMHEKRKTPLLVLGILLLIAYGLGIILIIAYFFVKKREHTIVVAPDGGKLFEVAVKDHSSKRIEEFIKNVQEAQLARAMMR